MKVLMNARRTKKETVNWVCEIEKETPTERIEMVKEGERERESERSHSNWFNRRCE